ncbi:acetylornithine deacetylase [Peribacillus huizhouensis]|uniref:Probable succinyl-diaminopimelate desuccinylase n=2 Tax=Bacillales TaxID=1385 RepID=A0ABR6CSK0_9BACI|nr:acetylornithine deacetylase [Peribacillus huizhouensis]
MDKKHKVIDWINENYTKGVKLLSKLIQEPSKRGNEGGAQAIIIEKCRELGLELDIWEIGDDVLKNHPHFHCDRSDFMGNPNLVAIKKGKGLGKSILLNGHIDVVPEGNQNDWEIDPFSGRIMNGRVYGRGSTDMKGGNVSLLLAIEAILASGINLKGDMIFQSVIEEESGGAGTLAAVLRGYRADGAIIPEPTNMKIFPLQQGSMWFRLIVKGKSAHAGTRYEGVSAIEQSIFVIEAIRDLENKRNEALTHPLYENISIPIPINLGKIHGGEWPSSVPDTVILEGRLGVAPFETVEDAKESLKACIKELNSSFDWFSNKPVELEFFGARWLPGYIDLDHPFLQTMQAAYKEKMNREAKLEASPWATDGGYLSGVGGIPTIVFGPGKTELAHDANEYIEIEKMIEAAQIIAITILDWCEVAEE